MHQVESEYKQGEAEAPSRAKRFVQLTIGLFFLVSSLSLAILMYLLLQVWQPIWSSGFKDFHTISDAIGKLDQTTQPAANTIPLMLAEMVQMNKNMDQMQLIMREMNESMIEIEKVTPNMQVMTSSINQMDSSVHQMNQLLDTRMSNLIFMMGRIENKMPDMDFMPFN